MISIHRILIGVMLGSFLLTIFCLEVYADEEEELIAEMSLEVARADQTCLARSHEFATAEVPEYSQLLQTIEDGAPDYKITLEQALNMTVYLHSGYLLCMLDNGYHFMSENHFERIVEYHEKQLEKESPLLKKFDH